MGRPVISVKSGKKQQQQQNAGKTKEEPPVLSNEDTETKQLDDRRKELRKKEIRSESKKVEYTELTKTGKRSADKDHVELYFKVVEDQNRYTKEDRRKTHGEMEIEENEVQTYRNEILKICACFYTELCSSTLQDQYPSVKNTSPDSLEIPLIMTSEVKKTLNEMKKNPTPWA